MFEIPEPPSDHRGQVINDGAQTLASGAFCLLAYLVLEAFETFVPYPAPSCLEAVAQKLKALSLDQTVPNVGFVRMQAQPVFLHPYFDLFECRLRL